MSPIVTRTASLGLLAVVLSVQTGCRAISRFGDNQQSIAARGLSRQGLKAMHEGDWDTAETLFTDALNISSVDDDAHRGIGEAHWNNGDRDTAIEHMEQASRLSAGDPKHVQRLGEMYLDVGRLAEANEQSIVALQADRQSAQAWALRGDCYYTSGNYDGALAAYHRALSIQPEYPKAQMQAAEIYNHQSKFDRVLATMDRLQDGTGGQQIPARADMLRGIAMNQLGRPGEARTHFIAAATKQPADPQPHLRLASTALKLGDFAAAQLSMTTAIRLDPQLANDQEMIADFQNQQRIASKTFAAPGSPPRIRK